MASADMLTHPLSWAVAQFSLCACGGSARRRVFQLWRASRSGWSPFSGRGFRTFLGTALLFLSLTLLPAASPRFAVDIWTEKNGLPQNEVFAITQTRDGYLWLGTPSGLTRFDGVDFRLYEDRDIPGLNGSKVVKLFEDSRGNLWIGTEASGVLVVDRSGTVKTVVPAKGGEGHLAAKDLNGSD